MKYKPKYSNFDEMQDEIAERLMEAKNTLEDVKDAIAKEVDEYVEAILREQVEETEVTLQPGEGECPIDVMFAAGEKVDSKGRIDLFHRKVPLIELLDGFKWWDELGPFTDTKPKEIRHLADRMSSFAVRLRQTADRVEQEAVEDERKLKEEFGL
jgi:hypothetical protein